MVRIMEKMLFVCLGNLDRSPTAEDLFKNHKKCDVKSCGISESAAQPVTQELVEWADTIFVMESWHRDTLLKRFPSLVNKPIINLSIPDFFMRGDPRLIELLKERLEQAGWCGD